jgi:hypothetical protein
MNRKIVTPSKNKGWEVRDDLSMMQQLGVVPAHGQERWPVVSRQK